MAETNPSGHPVPDPLETEFDLREGILILAAWWREILCLAVVAMVLGTAAYIVVPVQYEAAADVVVLRARTGVVFDDERFKTLSEGGRQPAAGLPAGQDTLFGLVSSGAVALAVSERLKEWMDDFQWEPADVEPAALLESVDAEVVGVGGRRNVRSGQASVLVRITARAGSPASATLIANLWAEAYVNLVNSLYAPGSAQQLASITNELVEAQQAYDTVQRELEEFVSVNEDRRVEQEVDARVAVLEGHFASELEGLRENRATRRRLRRLSAAARSLWEQIDAGGAASLVSNGLAIQLLKVETYVTAARLTPPTAPEKNAEEDQFDKTTSLTTSLVLNFNNSPDLILDFGNFGGTHADVASQRADIEALDQALRSWLAHLDQTIAGQSADLSRTGFYRTFPATTSGASGPPTPRDGAAPAVPSIEGQYEEIRSLEARLEALNKRKEQLTSHRDRLFTTLDVLRNKEAEFRLAAAVSQPELRVASPAVQPLPIPTVGRHLLPPALISAIVGVMLGVAVAFIGNFLGGRPFLVRDA